MPLRVTLSQIELLQSGSSNTTNGRIQARKANARAVTPPNGRNIADSPAREETKWSPRPTFKRSVVKSKLEWEPDSATKACNDCGAPFTFKRRRHHCRICGQIFCSLCSKNRLVVTDEGNGGEAMRACMRCMVSVVALLSRERQDSPADPEPTASVRSLPSPLPAMQRARVSFGLEGRFRDARLELARALESPSPTASLSSHDAAENEAGEPLRMDTGGSGDTAALGAEADEAAAADEGSLLPADGAGAPAAAAGASASATVAGAAAARTQELEERLSETERALSETQEELKAARAALAAERELRRQSAEASTKVDDLWEQLEQTLEGRGSVGEDMRRTVSSLRQTLSQLGHDP
eukprot:SAG11_NODE_1506_length_4781_cov_2.355831_3_plen_354_part_00